MASEAPSQIAAAPSPTPEGDDEGKQGGVGVAGLRDTLTKLFRGSRGGKKEDTGEGSFMSNLRTHNQFLDPRVDPDAKFFMRLRPFPLWLLLLVVTIVMAALSKSFKGALVMWFIFGTVITIIGVRELMRGRAPPGVEEA